jgi:hypothetical protein
VVTTVLLLVVVHLLLDLLNQTLLLLVLCARRTRSDASLLVFVSDAARGTNAGSVSSANVARSVGASLGGQVGSRGQRAGVGLHALALDVGVLADLLAAGGGDGVGVDAVVAAFLGGLQRGVGVVGLGWCNRGTAAGQRVGRRGATDGSVGDVLVCVHRVGGVAGGDVAGRDIACGGGRSGGRGSGGRRNGSWGGKISAGPSWDV